MAGARAPKMNKALHHNKLKKQTNPETVLLPCAVPRAPGASGHTRRQERVIAAVTVDAAGGVGFIRTQETRALTQSYNQW